MIKLLVAGSQAAELRAGLSGQLPEEIRVRYLEHASAAADADLDCDIAFGAPDILAELLPRLHSLQWLQSTWAGVTPLLACDRRDYRLTGVKGLFGRLMSEYVLGWLLALHRGILQHAAARHWQRPPERGLQGLRLGIAGTGSIGAAVAERCEPFVAEVVGLNSDGRAVDGFARCYATSDKTVFARGLDALVMLLPHTSATDRLVDGQVLDALAEGAMVINAGRANSLLLPAALDALERGRLTALVLDVLEEEPLPEADPLWEAPGVYITSHTAAPTDSDAVCALFLRNLQRYLGGEPLDGLVDFDRGY
jgi:phosphoglycerate dehydrogenase-like enzyme